MKGSEAIDRMRQVIRLQHKSLATEDCYVFWLRRYIAALRPLPKPSRCSKPSET